VLVAVTTYPPPASSCPRCDRFDFLCCDVPADGRFYLTSFTGEGMACGGYADGRWYYSTSWVRWHCGAKLQVTNPSTGECVVVEVAFVVRGPSDAADSSITQCWNLVALDRYWFSDEGQGGPADDEVCSTFTVVEPGEGPDDPDGGEDGGPNDEDSGSDDDDGGGGHGIDGPPGAFSGGCSCSQPSALRSSGAPLALVVLVTVLASRRRRDV